ncbi:MAG: phytanoyl-CoA dioxygenase family protein [Myxococcota bacterium]|nr:phytanoyl-CoA dioxygenase family protein [Myxococcota bacterium]
MPKLAHYAKDAPTDEILATVRSDGACILDDVLEPGFVAELRGETDIHMEATENGRDTFTGKLTTRTGGLVVRSEKCRELIQHPRILECCDGFLLEFCERYQLHLGQIIRIRPGETEQMIHRDRWAWGTHLAHVEPQLNTIWALTDFTAENGATRVAPGSPPWDDSRKPEPGEITQAEMKAGSVLLYTGSVFHGGGANASEADRIGLNITYTLGWLRQEENQYLSAPPELAKEFDSELQRLIGYSMGQYALGYYTPPGAPGQTAGITDPQFAVNPEMTQAGDPGEIELLANLSQDVGAKFDG